MGTDVEKWFKEEGEKVLKEVGIKVLIAISEDNRIFKSCLKAYET